MLIVSIGMLVFAIFLGALVVTSIDGWNVAASCPGTPEFCASYQWRFVVEYLPVWMYVGQGLVVIVIASPYSMLRIGRS